MRLRYDEAHDPNSPHHFFRTLDWDTDITDSDSTVYDHTAEITPPHIVVLSNADFGMISDTDDVHDAHDLTLTVTLPRDAGDGTIQVWSGTAWATPDDGQPDLDGYQVEFTLQQLNDGHVRYVHGGGEAPQIVMGWTVRDTGVDETDDKGKGDDLSSGPYKLKINVAPVNDRPTSDDVIRTVDEDGTQTFTRPEIPFADVDARPQDDELHSVKIMSITYGAGFGGTLKVNDRILKDGDFITADEIDSLTFTPDANQWDSVTVTIPIPDKTVIWQRYNGPVPGVRGSDENLWEDINKPGEKSITLSWSDLMALRVKPHFYKTLDLTDLGTYFTQPGTTTDVTAAWLETQAGHPDDGLVKVTVKNEARIQVREDDGDWADYTDHIADSYITTPDTDGADDGIQTLISHDLVAAGRVRVVENRKFLTFAELADTDNWHQLAISYKGMAVDPAVLTDPALLADNKVDLAEAQAIAGATLTYKGVTSALTSFAASDLTNKVDLAEAKAIAGATLTHNGVTSALTDFVAGDLTAKATMAKIISVSGSSILYQGKDAINSLAAFKTAYEGTLLTTVLTLADFQDADTPKDGPDGAGITSVSWDYTKDASHLGVTDKADFDFDGWDGTNPANRFKANALEITFTWNGITQTVTYADLMANKVFRLPSDFEKKAVFQYTLYGVQQQISAEDVYAGTVDLLPANFARKAIVKFTYLGVQHTASLADIVAGNKVDLLPPNFATKAMVEFTYLGVQRTASLADIIAANKIGLLPANFLDVAEARFTQSEGLRPTVVSLSRIEKGEISWSPSGLTRADVDAAVGAPTIGLLTVPDGAAWQIYDQATDSWVTVTDDAAPDRPGQQVEVDLIKISFNQARLVAVDTQGTPVALQPSDAFVTVKVRVFDGTELSSVERDIRVHVKAVNDAPTAEDGPSGLIPQFFEDAPSVTVTTAGQFDYFIDNGNGSFSTLTDSDAGTQDIQLVLRLSDILAGRVLKFDPVTSRPNEYTPVTDADIAALRVAGRLTGAGTDEDPYQLTTQAGEFWSRWTDDTLHFDLSPSDVHQTGQTVAFVTGRVSSVLRYNKKLITVDVPTSNDLSTEAGLEAWLNEQAVTPVDISDFTDRDEVITLTVPDGISYYVKTGGAGFYPDNSYFDHRYYGLLKDGDEVAAGVQISVTLGDLLDGQILRVSRIDPLGPEDFPGADLSDPSAGFPYYYVQDGAEFVIRGGVDGTDGRDGTPGTDDDIAAVKASGNDLGLEFTAKTAGVAANGTVIKFAYDATLKAEPTAVWANDGAVDVLTVTFGTVKITLGRLKAIIDAADTSAVVNGGVDVAVRSHRDVTDNDKDAIGVFGVPSDVLAASSPLLFADRQNFHLRDEDPDTDGLQISFTQDQVDSRLIRKSVYEVATLDELLAKAEDGEDHLVTLTGKAGTLWQVNEGTEDSPDWQDLSSVPTGDGHQVTVQVKLSDLRAGKIRKDIDNQPGLITIPAITEDGEFHFADVLSGRGDANRLAKYEAFFGFDDVDKTTQGASEDWSLVAIRFTDLPSEAEGVLYLRPHDQVWYDASADSSAILRQWDGAGPPDTELSDPGFADRRVRRDRDDGDVDVVSAKVNSLDQTLIVWCLLPLMTSMAP